MPHDHDHDHDHGHDHGHGSASPAERRIGFAFFLNLAFT
jgi:Co/Zn/Cd efflux system component